MTPNDQHIKIFIAYARKDVEYLNQLRTYLAPLERNKTIEIWYDGEIVPGTEWENEIKTHLQTADIIVLLVSANSLASDYFHDKEMMKALERHRNNEVVVVPVILSACDWKGTELKDLQALPKDGKTVRNWEDEAEAYMSVVMGLKKSIEKYSTKNVMNFEGMLDDFHLIDFKDVKFTSVRRGKRIPPPKIP